MLKKLWDWICLVMGVTPPGEAKPADKWKAIREEREAWERAQREARDRAGRTPSDETREAH